MKAALVVLVVAGCTDPGVYIEVIATPNTDEVELYFGASACTSQDTVTGEACTRLQPDTFTRPVDAAIFLRDRDEPYRADVEDGSAWFRLSVEPLAVMPRLVAVGREDGVARSVAVVPNLALDSTRKVQIVLEDAPTWTGDMTFQGLGVMEWDDGRCVGVHEGGDPQLFVVAAGDPDCDRAPIECDPLAYLVDEVLNQPCLSATGNQCSIGRMGCSELTQTQTACLPGDQPLPAAICERCGAEPNPLACVAEGIRDTFPRVICDLHYGEAIKNGSAACPSSAPGAIPAIFVDETVGEYFCPLNAVIAPAQLPLDFTTQLSTPQGVTYTLGAASPDCSLALGWFPTVIPNQVLIEPTFETLLFWARDAIDGRNQIMPMELHFSKNCEEPPTCLVVDQ